MMVDAVPSEARPHGGRLLGRGRNGDAWAVPASGSTVVLRRMAGLAAAAGEVELLRERLDGVEAAVAPLGSFARAGDLWLVYPWVEGSAPGPAAQAAGASPASVATAVTAAVGQVHAAGLAHGTISEGNVRISSTGDVRLLEVGLADLGREPGASAGDDRHALGALLAALGGSGRSTARRLRPRPARRRPAAVAGAALGLAATGVAAASLVGSGRRDGAAVPPAHGTAGPPSSAPALWPISPPPTGCVTARAKAPPGRVVQLVDTTGTGCAQPLVWHAGVALTAMPDGSPVRFSIGQAGDMLLVGHWRCAPAQLPAVYRPSTGQLFYLRVWPRPGGSSSSLPAVDTGVRDGRPVVVGGRCQRVEVDG